MDPEEASIARLADEGPVAVNRMGLLEETRDGPGLLAELHYTKTPLWRACLRLPTDGAAQAPVLH
ncbi:MAG: hypothetical protein AAF371_16715 [Pseudomonadota bacterium]